MSVGNLQPATCNLQPATCLPASLPCAGAQHLSSAAAGPRCNLLTCSLAQSHQDKYCEPWDSAAEKISRIHLHLAAAGMSGPLRFHQQHRSRLKLWRDCHHLRRLRPRLGGQRQLRGSQHVHHHRELRPLTFDRLFRAACNVPLAIST